MGAPLFDWDRMQQIARSEANYQNSLNLRHGADVIAGALYATPGEIGSLLVLAKEIDDAEDEAERELALKDAAFVRQWTAGRKRWPRLWVDWQPLFMRLRRAARKAGCRPNHCAGRLKNFALQWEKDHPRPRKRRKRGRADGRSS